MYDSTVKSAEPEKLSDWQGRGGKKYWRASRGELAWQKSRGTALAAPDLSCAFAALRSPGALD
jgi:hypothetical protein